MALVMRAPYPDTPRLARQARALAEAGADVHVVCLRRGPDEPPSEQARGVRVTRLGGTRRRGSRLRYVEEYGRFGAAAAVLLHREAAGGPLDLVQVTNPPDAMLATAVAPRLAGAALVLDVYDLAPELYASKFGGGERWPLGARVLAGMERVAVRAADHVLVAGDAFRRRLVARGAPPGRVTALPNCPDERDLDAALRTAPRPGQVVYHGSFFDRYGVSLIVEAWPRIAAGFPGATLDLWGDGPALADLLARASRMPAGHRIRHHGVAPHARVPQLIANAAVGLSLLRRDQFTDVAFPAKVFEYTQLGVPVAASRTTALRDTFSTDAIAYFRSGDPDGVADAVLRLLRDPSAASRQAAVARAETAPFLWSRWRDRYVALVLGLADRRALSAR